MSNSTMGNALQLVSAVADGTAIKYILAMIVCGKAFCTSASRQFMPELA